MKTWNRLLSGLSAPFALAIVSLCCLSIVLTLSPAQAQNTVDKYRVTTPSLSWNDISGSGTQIYGDVMRYYEGPATTSLPFDFKYDGGTISAYTTIYIFNGVIGLGTQMYSGYTNGGLGDPSFTNSLFPWGCNYVQMGDHAYNTSSYDGATEDIGIYEEVSGSSPNQVYTIQLNGVHTAWGALWNSASSICDMQIKLYESNGRIQFLYRSHGNYMGGSYNASIGINGGSSFTSNTAVSNTSSTPGTDIQFDIPIPPSAFSLHPQTLDFGAVVTGQSLVLNDTLQSSGGSDLIINSATITGSSEYTILNPPTAGTAVPAGSTYIFRVQFTPSTTGSRNATLKVATNAGTNPTQSVFLNGTGAAPLVQYTFSGTYPPNTLFHRVSLHFGDSAVQCFNVKSTGLAPLTFNSVSTIGLQANMYTVVHMPQNPLPPGVTDSICVRFQPYLEGRPDAQLVVNTNAFNQPFDTVQLFGTGKLAHLIVTPQTGTVGTGTTNGILTFDSVAIGDSVCKTLTLHNSGTDTLNIKKQIVTYGDYDFHFYPLTKADTLLVPDASKLVNVCFVPLAAGNRLATIRFYTNIPKTYPDQRDTSQFLIQVSGVGVPFGKLAVAGTFSDSAIIGTTKCINDTIRNTGTADLTITSVKLSGTNASEFTLSGITTPMILAAKAGQPVQICYSPHERGLSTASLNIIGTTSGKTVTMSLPIIGVGQQVCMDALPNPVTFGSAAYPSMTLARTGHDTTCITITNCGDVPMTFTGTLGAGSSSSYMLTTASTPMIAPLATGSICVAYSPDSLGSSTGSVTITPSESSLAAMTLPLSGSGAGVFVAPKGQPLATAIGRCDTFTVTLTNNGNVAWTPGTATITGSSDFTVVSEVTPTSIAAAQSGTMQVSYCPTSSGSSTAQLVFNNASPMPLGNGVPYQLNGVASSSVSARTEQDGFSIGASYPNPTANSANVIVTLPREAKITVTLIGLDGAQVASVYSGSLSAGQHVLSVNAKGLANGTYFYMLESAGPSGKIRLVREMIVTH